MKRDNSKDNAKEKLNHNSNDRTLEIETRPVFKNLHIIYIYHMEITL